MYNPDQHYTAHALHLKELSEQVKQRRIIAALAQHRPARVRAAGRLLGLLLVRLGMWLSRSATSSRQELRWRAFQKPDRWRRTVAMPSSACGNTEGVCDVGGYQSCACCTHA
jgi:hypothetical protein